ncbi:MAG: LemA family protein [Treponema sp.]|nr:LemA family protein [Treponema sp.]
MSNSSKKILIVVAAILVVAFAAYRFFVGNYNSIVGYDEAVEAAWAQVQNQYQRRVDLIPNLVSTVKGYASHEKDTFVQVTQARAAAESMAGAGVPKDAAEMEKIQAAQNSLTAGVRNLLVVAENYPELKADQNFLALQDQLEGTENRIAVARQDYNKAVQKYNTFIRRFPQSLVANQHGFEKRPQFAASQEAQSAPKVEF